uniref:Ubiquitin carboxyl-terminal hydrolase 47 n=1 Tax=Eutreptiella gymnastica TaxID=73025 RepID=A0A7S4GIH8_9EUGL
MWIPNSALQESLNLPQEEFSDHVSQVVFQEPQRKRTPQSSQTLQGSTTSKSPSPIVEYKEQGAPSSGHQKDAELACSLGSQVAEEDVLLYQERKGELQEAIARHGESYFREKSATGLLGLYNQGATCYLNSLLQTLYMTPEVRAFVYHWKHDPTSHGPSETCILAQLQSLFAQLELSEQAAVNTKQLTTSFGWGSAVAFQQHDVQELLRVLFDALGQTSDDFAAVKALYEAHLEDYITCPERDVTRCRREPYMDLQLNVQGMPSVESALGFYVQPETLDGDNRWELDDGERVAALKGLRLDTVPDILTLHLKRFLYDWNLGRRLKVNDPQTIPLTLDMAAYTKSDAVQTPSAASQPLYDLFSIFIHSGTAMGGHYHCYARHPASLQTCVADPFGHWYDFNDAVVSPVSETELKRMLGTAAAEARGDHGADPDPKSVSVGCDPSGTQGIKSSLSSGSSANAYMLMYRRRGLPVPPADALQMPESQRVVIEEDNARYGALRRLKQIQDCIVELRVYSQDGLQCTLPLLKTTSLLAAVEKAREALCKAAAASPGGVCQSSAFADAPLGCLRLRKYSRMTGRGGETFTAREAESLLSVGLGPSEEMLLEVRGPAEEWQEYNPDEMMLHVVKWDPRVAGCAPEGCEQRTVTVPGDQKATVGSLRIAVASAYGLPVDRVCLVHAQRRDGSVQVLEEDGRELRKDYHVWSGEQVWLEVTADSAEGHTSALFRELEEKRNTITVSYNELGATQFDHSMTADLTQTLAKLKADIAGRLKVSPESIHLKRNWRAAQFKNEEETLRALGLTDGSVVYVGEGAPRKANECLMKFFLLSGGKFKQVFEMPVSGSLKVADLKVLLVERLQSMDQSVVGDWTCKSELLRLREKKDKEARKVLRDDAVVKKMLLRWSDGQEMAMQLLNQPETVGAEDIIIQVRRWYPAAKRLEDPTEVVVCRQSSVASLRAMLGTKFGLGPDGDSGLMGTDADEAPSVGQGQGCQLGLAKGTTFGPPIDDAGLSKLKWNDRALLPKMKISEPPLSLRDGSLLFVRDEAEMAQMRRDSSNSRLSAAPDRARPARGGRLAKSSPFSEVQVPKNRPKEQPLHIQVYNGTAESNSADVQGPPESELGKLPSDRPKFLQSVAFDL